MKTDHRRWWRALCLLVGLSVLVAPLSVWAADEADDPFGKGADDAAKRDPFFKKPPPPPKPATPPVRPDATEEPKDPDKTPGAADGGKRPGIMSVKVSPRQAEVIQKVIRHYIEMYDQHLRSPAWVTRAMAVISLAKIDAPQITERLLAVAAKDRDAKVSVYAWEALHARAASLSDEQRTKWLAAGCRLARRGDLAGATRAGLIRGIGAAAPTAEHQRVLMDLFAKTSLLAPEDKDVLEAMREAVAAWKSPVLVRQLVAQMNNVNTAHRADFVLSGLGATVTSGATLENNTTRKESTVRGKKWLTYTRMGSRAAWAQVRKDWASWLRTAKLTPPTADQLTPYAGKSVLLAAPQKIIDPMDRKWTKDLELPKFSLKTFEVNFVLDSTGSMSRTMTWIKGDIARMMRALALVSTRPKMGVTLYRDFVSGMRTEDYLVTVSTDPRSRVYGGGNYVVKLAPMMSEADRLAKAIKTAYASGGGDTPEAVYEAIWAAINKNTWARSGAKLIVLVGDAPPHAKTMDKLKTLVTQSRAKGFGFLCVKVSDAYRQATVKQEYKGTVCDLESSFNLIAEWGKGKAVTLGSGSSSGSSSSGASGARVTPVGYSRIRSRLGRGMYGTASANADTHYQIIAEVLKTQLARYYHDRVDPFVRVLLELAVVSPPEARTIVPPYSSSREVRVVVRRPTPRPTRPRPTPKPRPQPKPRKIERVYYVIDNKALAYIYYDFDNKRALSAAIYVDDQGRYTWQYVRRTEDMQKISSRGKKITTERATEITSALASGKDPFK